jgi:O-antigen/teichoic acid export membrane protein
MMSLSHVDVVMVRLIRDGTAAGHYKAALVLAEYLWLVPVALQSLLLHSSSRLWSQDKLDRIESLTSDLTRYVFLTTSLLAIGMYVLAGRFVPLYFGAEFTATVEPLALLLPGVVGFALARPIYAVNKASGRLGLLVGALGIAAAFNLGANALLIPRYGLPGAAVATSASYGSMFLLQAWCAHRLGYSPLRSVRPGRAAVTVLVSFGVIAAVDVAIPSDYLALAVVPVVGAAVFTAVAVLTGAVDRAELDMVVSLLPPPLEDGLRSIAARVR